MQKKNPGVKKEKDKVADHQVLVKESAKGDHRLNLILYFVLAIISLGIYGNTLHNKYCLDDAMMITQNRVTQKGFNGIKEHLTHSFLYGFLPPGGNINAGSSRWRPLPLITYSVEIGLWGTNKPAYSHLINILTYTLLILLLFHLLNTFLLKDLWLSFFASLLFAIHPIHTEAVANIKGRDELLCLFFLLLSLTFLWNYIKNKKIIWYISSLIFYFISLTSKETSFTFLAGIPLMLYFFSKSNRNKIITLSSGFLATALLYILVRNTMVPLSNVKPAGEIMNNPFFYATGIESFCTKIYILLLYLKTVLVPFPLRYDYSYDMIPYLNISSIWVWASSIVYLILFIYAIMNVKKKNIFSFCILMFLFTLSVSSNLIVEIGMTMGERLLFIPSVFICIFLAVSGQKTVHYLNNKFNFNKVLLSCILIFPFFIVSSAMVIARNVDWKDDVTLNIADNSKCERSVRVNGGTGNAYITLSEKEIFSKKQKDSLIFISLEFFKKALKIFPEYTDAYLNMGVAYSRIDSISKAEENWNKARTLYPDHPKIKEYDGFLSYRYRDMGLACETRKSFDSALFYYDKVLKYWHQNDTLIQETLYHMGGLYYLKANYRKSHEILGELLKILPENKNVQAGFNETEILLKREEAAINK